MIHLLASVGSYPDYNATAVLTFAFLLIVFVAVVLWLFYERRRR